MKLKLTQPGFETYNGQMGLLNFVDGLSTKDVLPAQAVRMAAVMLCLWEDDSSPSITQGLLDKADMGAPMYSASQDGSDHDKAAGLLADVRATVVAMSKTSPDKLLYSVEQLEAIADKSGIKGLREISDPLGIKSNSIKELIDAILKQGAPIAAE